MMLKEDKGEGRHLERGALHCTLELVVKLLMLKSFAGGDQHAACRSLCGACGSQISLGRHVNVGYIVFLAENLMWQMTSRERYRPRERTRPFDASESLSELP